MSTHNICIRREIRKILCGYPLISVAMPQHIFSWRAKENTPTFSLLEKCIFFGATAYSLLLKLSFIKYIESIQLM